MANLSRGVLELRSWRAAAKLTQVQAAALIGIDPWYYRKIERGRRTPGRVVACRIETATKGRIRVAKWGEASETRAAG